MRTQTSLSATVFFSVIGQLTLFLQHTKIQRGMCVPSMLMLEGVWMVLRRLEQLPTYPSLSDPSLLGVSVLAQTQSH